MENQITESGSEKPEGSNHQSVVQSQAIVVPNVSRAKEAMRAFEQLKRELLIPKKDWVQIGGKQAITRSGFSKIALAFNVSTSIVKITRLATKDDYIVHVITRASFPNGRYAEANGSCAMSEFKSGGIQGTIANCEAKAMTRSASRSTANLCGGSWISVDELMVGEEPEEEHPQVVRSQAERQQPQEERQMSMAQKNLINKLAMETNVKVESVVKTTLKDDKAELDKLTMSQAHQIIEALNLLKKKV